ncbi:MAG: hypothetical protein H6Q51_1264 [Deltaproteobacteria bacterium]|nr:hypothetical protein [Deltaproteobacteria bacterium]
MHRGPGRARKDIDGLEGFLSLILVHLGDGDVGDHPGDLHIRPGALEGQPVGFGVITLDEKVGCEGLVLTLLRNRPAPLTFRPRGKGRAESHGKEHHEDHERSHLVRHDSVLLFDVVSLAEISLTPPTHEPGPRV